MLHRIKLSDLRRLPSLPARLRSQEASNHVANLPLAFAQGLDTFRQTFRYLMTPFTASHTGDYRNFVEERLLKTRTIMIYGGINQALAQDVSEKLIILSDDSDEDITIYLNSQGGHVEAGDTIFDMIRHVTPRVRIVGTGWVASAGALIYAAPPKDCRFALPNTRFMLHQPSGGVGGTASDVKIEVEELIKMRRRLNQIFSDQTGQPIERVTEDSDRNFWMTAQEAVDYGLAGDILESAAELT